MFSINLWSIIGILIPHTVTYMSGDLNALGFTQIQETGQVVLTIPQVAVYAPISRELFIS